MRKIIYKFLLLTVLVGLTTLSYSSDNAKAKAAIANGYKRWVAADQNKDAQALAGFYDDDAVLMPPREEPVIGKQAIYAWYQKFVQKPGTSLDEVFNPTSFYITGDIAIDTSDFDGTFRSPDAKDIKFHGKNIGVWRPEKDGSWRILRDPSDSIPPPQPT